MLTTTYQKAFVLRPNVPCKVLFNSMTIDPRGQARGGARGQNLVPL